MCGMTPERKDGGGRAGEKKNEVSNADSPYFPFSSLWPRTAASNGGLDQAVQLLVTADGQLQMARRDTLHLEILRGVARQLEHLSRQVLQDGRAVHGSRGTHAAARRRALLQVTVDTAHRELYVATKKEEKRDGQKTKKEMVRKP